MGTPRRVGWYTVSTSRGLFQFFLFFDPTCSKFTQDWIIILLAHRLFTYNPCALTFVAALFIMALGQRGLACVGHDAIHGNLASNRVCSCSRNFLTLFNLLIAKQRLNDTLANLFLAPPLLSTATTQRKQHSAHHHLLGTKDDPDHGEGNETSLRHYRVS